MRLLAGSVSRWSANYSPRSGRPRYRLSRNRRPLRNQEHSFGLLHRLPRLRNPLRFLTLFRRPYGDIEFREYQGIPEPAWSAAVSIDSELQEYLDPVAALLCCQIHRCHSETFAVASMYLERRADLRLLGSLFLSPRRDRQSYECTAFRKFQG